MQVKETRRWRREISCAKYLLVSYGEKKRPGNSEREKRRGFVPLTQAGPALLFVAFYQSLSANLARVATAHSH